MGSRFSKALLIALLSSTTACVTTPKRHRKGPAEQPLAKAGQKVPGSDVKALPGQVPAAPAAPTPAPAPQTDYPGLWARASNIQTPMSDADLMQATQLYPTQPASLEEAIFIVTQMRILQKDWDRRTSSQTQDLHTNKTADNTAGLSLERTFQDLEVDLPIAIRGNANLKNHDALMLAKQLLSHTRNGDAFKATLSAAIKEKGAEWPDVIADDTAPAAAVAASAAAPVADPNSALDLMGSDTLLIAAQKLADKRDFKGALDHVKRIKKEDPFYAQAQEKLKMFSNRAVKDLRQKAAEAFSNAAPLNDAKAKTNYLKQAKNYLEQALQDFPASDQLATVKENLEAVDHDLEALDKSGT